MIFTLNRPSLRAVPALAAGMALLLLSAGCRPKLPPEKPTPKAEALEEESFERVQEEFPSYPERPQVEFDILNTLFRMEAFDLCLSRGEAWLKRNAGHPKEGDVRRLLGRCEVEAGRPVQALSHWIKAAALLSDSPRKLSVLDDEAHHLIEQASLERLEAMAEQRKANPYLPDILHRIALIHADRGNLIRAREAAKDLLDATSSPHWRLEGRKILARIDEELSVGRGRIGCLLPLSGSFAIYGQEALNGIQMGMAQWLSAPGEPEIELIIRDTEGDSETAMRAVEDLALERRVMAIVGPLSSKVAEAAAGRAQELGVPIISLAQKESIPAIGEMVFRNFLTPSMEMDALADYSFHELGLRRFGILYPDNPYGRHFMHLFWDRVKELGGTITAVEPYPPDKTDFSDEVRKMVGLYHPRPPSVRRMLEQIKAESGVTKEEDDDEPEPIVDFEAVFIPDNSERAALVVPQLPFHRILGVQLLGTSLWQSEGLIEQAGDYIQGAVLPSGFFHGDETEPAASFVEQYRNAFGKTPDLLPANGYDTIRYLRKVLMDKKVMTRKDLSRAICKAGGMDGVTGNIRFDTSGEVLKRPVLLTVKRNRFIPVSQGPEDESTAGSSGNRTPVLPAVQGVSIRSSDHSPHQETTP